MLNDYFRTVDEKLIGPTDEIHAHSRQNVDIRTTTSITISQMEIEEKMYKLKVTKLKLWGQMAYGKSLTGVYHVNNKIVLWLLRIPLG